MFENILSLVISLLASLLFELLKVFFIKIRSKNAISNSSDGSRYSLRSIRAEFYISFVLGISFSLVKDSRSALFNKFIHFATYFSFFIALMGFMCLDEKFKNISENVRDQAKCK